ncbi:MAG: sugar phosphate isomerase/epimerase [Candidatus Bathyarchaeota archaeon]|nr:sugar phosphate isomerase/epimerase [Candidatus Bathyarchaeota archaeon]
MHMFVGFLTAPLREWSLEKIVEWASENRFKGLEVLVSPTIKHVDVNRVLAGGAGEVKRLFHERDLKISGLAFYSIRILEDEGEQNFLLKVIEAASALDVGVVCTLSGGPVKGKDKMQTLREDFPRVFSPIVDAAREHGLKIALENWYATNLQGLDHFQAAFESIPDKTLGLNFDPSHLFWQQIDYIEAVYRFGERIYHTHAKDTEILPFKLRYVGVLGRGWWRYRIPGWGGINWRSYITALREVGYKHVLSIEHEDPFFSPEDGLISGLRFLEGLLLST